MKHNVEYYIPKEWEHCDLFPNLKNKVSVNDIKNNVSSTHQEPSFVYHNIPNNSGLLEINGFFQSWKYLEGVENEVIDELSFSKERIDQALFKMSKDTIKLCVHVRWGDIYDRETGGGHKGFEKWHPTMSLKIANLTECFCPPQGLIVGTGQLQEMFAIKMAAVELLLKKVLLTHQKTILDFSILQLQEILVPETLEAAFN